MDSDTADGRDLSGRVLYDRAGRRFQLVRLLGTGSFGSVYRAKVRSPGGLELEIALKLLHEREVPGSQPVARLLDEAALLARMRHPVIVTAHDLAWITGLSPEPRPALMIEYVEGLDLEEILRDRDHPLPLSVLLNVICQVASALDAAFESCGIVHRDVKPANIRIARHGNVKLLDFGIARSEAVVREASPTTGVVGSLYFVAPERFDLRHPLDPASDVFALGCVLYEGMTGRGVFRELDLRGVILLAQNGPDMDAFVQHRLSVPMLDDVRSLLTTMLAHNPRARPTAAQVAALCEALFNLLPEQVTLRAWCQEHPWPTDPSDDTQITDRFDPPVIEQTTTEIRPRLAPDLEVTVFEAMPAPIKPRPAEPTTTVAIPRPPSPTPSAPVRWLGLGFAALIPLGLLGLCALALLALALRSLWSPPQPAAPVHPQLIVPVAEEVAEEAPDEIPLPRARPALPTETSPTQPVPTETSPTAPLASSARVNFAGPVGAVLYVDGLWFGETNLSYDVTLGEHICGAGYGVIEQSGPCTITPETRTVKLPDLPPPGSVSSQTAIELLRSDGVRFLPGLVPSGAYEIHADLGDGMKLRGKMIVRPNFSAWVTCDQQVGVCFAR